MSLKEIIRIEMQTKVQEWVEKSQRTDYKSGGYLIKETIIRRTKVGPSALLECGHWTEVTPQSSRALKAKRLRCWECESQNLPNVPESQEGGV